MRYHAPTLSIDDAANMAKDRYGLVGVTIEPLPSERDQNFHIVTGGTDPGFGARLRAAGKPKMVVVAAVMRKLLHIAYGVLQASARV